MTHIDVDQSTLLNLPAGILTDVYEASKCWVEVQYDALKKPDCMEPEDYGPAVQEHNKQVWSVHEVALVLWRPEEADEIRQYLITL